MSVVTVAGLIRVRSWYSQRAAADVVGGLGWSRESRSSELESIVFRGGPLPIPTILLRTQTVRQLVPVILGFDLLAGGKRVGLVGSVCLHFLVGPREESRSDLELGRQVVRLSLGVRWSF